ncbi:MAG: hypothetical protein K6U04_08975 [Armatimonadetes bacterium]|nr:hypothetical protein [Armatimonadota bacterium]
MLDDTKLLKKEIKEIIRKADEGYAQLRKLDIDKLLAEEPPFGPSRAQRREWERWRKKVDRRQAEVDRLIALGKTLENRLNKLTALYEQQKRRCKNA